MHTSSNDPLFLVATNSTMVVETNSLDYMVPVKRETVFVPVPRLVPVRNPGNTTPGWYDVFPLGATRLQRRIETILSKKEPYSTVFSWWHMGCYVVV
jgi:hypothetical protein